MCNVKKYDSLSEAGSFHITKTAIVVLEHLASAKNG